MKFRAYVPTFGETEADAVEILDRSPFWAMEDIKDALDVYAFDRLEDHGSHTAHFVVIDEDDRHIYRAILPAGGGTLAEGKA